MIVECPRCRARYRVESELLEQDQTFKCSRCGHVFAYEAEGFVEPPPSAVKGDEPAVIVPEPKAAAVEPPPPVPAPAAPESRRTEPRRDDDSLAFQFTPSVATRDDAARKSTDSRASAPPSSSIAENEDETDLDDFSFEEDVGTFEPSRPASRKSDLADEPRFVRGEDDMRVESEDRGNAGRPYLAFLAIMVIAYALFALNLLNHPAQAEKLLSSMPMVGEVLAEDHLLPIRVQLQDVEGVYQQIKDDRTVFIVSGRAVNTASEALKGVQIESAIYDASGQPIETKSIYCGNAMSLKIVKDLSSKEISLLQRLEPPKRFEIRPGESAGFSVVFLTPPKGAKEFTAKVVAAQSSTS